jgi:hypothetical protein
MYTAVRIKGNNGKEFNTTGFANLHIYSVYVNFILWRNLIRIRYSTIATKEAAGGEFLGRDISGTTFY